MNQNENQNEGGGLFSDEYEAPKRENPYLKKNRDKAKAEKKQEKQRQPKQQTQTTDAPRKEVTAVEWPVEQSVENVSPAEENESPRRKSFSDWMFEHVRVIAALATVVVVLSLVLITDVVSIVENMVTQSQQASKEELTLNYVKGLTEKSTPITWTDLQKFRYDRTDAKDSVTWMLPVKGTSFELWISGVSTDKPPVYIYLYDMRTGDRLVIGEEDFDTFIEEHTK